MIAMLSGALALTALPAMARQVAPAVDCPLRDQPYSTRSPLIDLLLKPEAMAVIDRHAPGLLDPAAPMFKSVTVPSFASIITLRRTAGFGAPPENVLAAIDRDLARLPVTARDKQARCARYDADAPPFDVPARRPAILVFEKMTGFLDAPSVEGARAALLAIGRRRGWTMVVTDKGGAITPANLRRFDAVIWNNVSGDPLTLGQRKAFRAYLEKGGGFVGLHGAGGDPVYFWDWYVETLLGARFIGHPMGPQFQEARIVVDDPASAIVSPLAPGWLMTDEWYSFDRDPRASGSHVLLTLDETTYSPWAGRHDLRMGSDHPIAWTRCIGNGRAFYSAIGHRPEGYSEPHFVQVLDNAIGWAAGKGATSCRQGKEIARGG